MDGSPSRGSDTTGPVSPPTSPSIRSISPPTRRSKKSSRKMVYVSIPTLSEVEKAAYKSFSEDPIPFGDEYFGMSFHTIIGEYKDGSVLYYFARPVENAQAFKIPATRMRTSHPKLVEQYEERKESGLVDLAHFDPGASYIEPSCRIHLKLSIPASKKKLRKRASSASSSDVAYSSEESEGELEDGGYSDPSIPLRRSSRQNTAASSSSTTLPFSPKKTRSGAMRMASEDADPLLAPDFGLRRSTRAKKTLRDNLDDNNLDDSGPSKIVKKKKPRPPGTRPAYGRVRGVADLNYDSDEETKSLRCHRSFCERCGRPPVQQAIAALGKKKKKAKKKDTDEEDDDDDTAEKLTALGGWVQCLKCPVSAHWGCLASSQRDEILRAILERERAEFRAKNGEGSSSGAVEPVKRSTLDVDSVTEFICGSCSKGGFCMACLQVAVEADSPATNEPQSTVAGPSAEVPTAPETSSDPADVVMAEAESKPTTDDSPPPKQLVFRCYKCKRVAHYGHLPSPFPRDEPDAASLASYYQRQTGWQCADCVSYVYDVDQILAWRPFPPNAVEPAHSGNNAIDIKRPLPREYLVKWQDRSYRRVQWVPHLWLVAKAHQRLKNFLSGARAIQLLPEPIAEDHTDDVMAVDGEGIPEPVEDDSSAGKDKTPEARTLSLGPLPDAERRIQPAWRSVDRVLDVLLWYPQKHYHKTKSGKQQRGKKKAAIPDSDNDELEGDDKEEADDIYDSIYTNGEQPPAHLVETVSEFEKRTKRPISPEDAELVVWGFFKWNDLGYDAATWDSPPGQRETAWSFFEKAFARFVASRTVTVPVRTKDEVALAHKRRETKCPSDLVFTKEKLPELGQGSGLKLMDFQVTGVNWLCSNWWRLQHCILADEMGLGKTVQIVTFLGVVIQRGAFPALVVVPNSTITNWVREFERWAPHLRVCSFYGDARSRDVIKNFELWHAEKTPKTTGAKFHVLVTTFETITNAKEFGPVFKQTPRWEVLVVDEGQRLKSDSSLIFKRLGELNTAQRIILTGTPLNNNIRELFNLMNFLDPSQWNDLEQLAKEHEDLTEERIKDLHVKLRPYFLRRVKAEVLKLPPKNEVIVPVSMAPLQKEVYRSILSQNAALLKGLSQEAAGVAKATASVKHARINMNNILMELRKCLQHPYLVSREIEPAGLSPADAHEKLIDASAKLRLLRVLLPKLKARGHRVLLFSQFSIGLDVVEDFLLGEKIKYLRLDGNTKQADRQKGMDEFNKPDSDVFIYILTTRAGGVGINLWTADTVIIFDPDFNPHQDLQAIARAHRYGQKKTCLVFKLMVKDSAEERIMQTGKKKLVLDHLIVQKMEKDDSKEDVKSILTFGAQTLFSDNENQVSRDITYSDHDLDNLIEKTEKEGDQQDEQSKEGSLFSFAKVWAADRDSLEEMNDEVDEAQQADSWAQTLQRLADEMTKQREEEATGRGVRRKAAAVFPALQQQLSQPDDSPQKGKKEKKKGRKGKGKATNGDDSDAYAASAATSDVDSMSNADLVPDDDSVVAAGKARASIAADPANPPLSPIMNKPSTSKQSKKAPPVCGLCGTRHSEGACFMTESAENLAEFRSILLSHAGDETLEERKAAIAIIDETLYRRGQLHLIFGQPLQLIESPIPVEVQRPPAAPRLPPALISIAEAPVGPPPQPSIPALAAQHGLPIQQPKTVSKPRKMVHPDVPSDFGSSLKKKPKAVDKKQRVVTAPIFLPQVPPVPSSAMMNGIAARPVMAPAFAASSSSAVTQPKAKPSPRPSLPVITNGNLSTGQPTLKRPAAPEAASVVQKRQKISKEGQCVVCNGPYHLLNHCPLAKDPATIQAEIRRLEGNADNAQTVTILKHLMKKRQAAATAASGSAAA